MAKWGSRVALAFALAMLAGLLATTLATGASAEVGDPSQGLTVRAGLTGDGTDVRVVVEGCPADTPVRILIDGYPFDDYLMTGGRLDVVVEVPDWLLSSLPLDVVKAYCFATGGYAFANIEPGVDPGPGPDTDPDKIFGEGCEIVYDFSGLEVVGDTFIADRDYAIVGLFINTNESDATVFYDVKAGDKLQTAGGEDIIKLGLCGPGIDIPDKIFGPGCYFEYDFSNLNVVGDTFIADQNYDVVGLFINSNESDATIFYDVTFGQVMQTAGGEAIIKIGFCGPGGTPGYTPKGDLRLEANLDATGANINYIVVGCRQGAILHLFVDNVWQTEVIVGSADRAQGSIPTPAGLPLVTFLADCEGRFGLTGIGGGGAAPAAPAAPATVGSDPATLVSDDGGETATATPGTDATLDKDTAPGKEIDETTEEVVVVVDPVKVKKLIAERKQAVADKVAAYKYKNTQAISLPPLEDGIPVDAVAGAGERSVANPASAEQRAVGSTSEGTKGASEGFPTTQAGLGALSAAGLLAFVGLRRVSKTMAYQPNHAE